MNSRLIPTMSGSCLSRSKILTGITALTVFMFTWMVFAVAACGQSEDAKTPKAVEMADGLSAPTGLAFDRRGNLYVAEHGADRITMFTPDRDRVIIAENIEAPTGVAVDSDGNVYVTTRDTGQLWKITRNGSQHLVITGNNSETATQNPDMRYMTPAGLVSCQDGSLLTADCNTGSIHRIAPDGTRQVAATGFNHPVGLVLDRDGNAWVSCWGDGCLYRISLN